MINFDTDFEVVDQPVIYVDDEPAFLVAADDLGVVTETIRDIVQEHGDDWADHVPPEWIDLRQQESKGS